MNLRNLANQDVATISSCDTEPIHIPGAIQPHGVLIALDKGGTVVVCSQNAADFFGKEPAQLLRQPLVALHPELYRQLQPALAYADAAKPFLLSHTGGDWTVFAAESEGLLLVELEQPTQGTAAVDIFDQTKEFVQLLERSQSLADLSQRIADQVRRLTGYDRVMVYRFDKEFNGQVFAESKREGLEPFLHLHYPHTDIPVQARELYLRNHLRMIADVGYAAVPLLAPEGGAEAAPDLSDSVLRSVSPIHLQYLKNMGVAATLTVSLLCDGQLWGLIACHHHSAKHLHWQQRQAALLQGHFLTSQIKVRQVAEEYAVQTVVEAHLQQLLNQVPQQGDFALKFSGFTSLLNVANASGVAVLHKGQLFDKGLVPPADKTKALFAWLADNVSGLSFSTSELRRHYPAGEKLSRAAAGLLYQKLGNAKRDAIIWFREEQERTIHWAGDPHDAVRKVQENTLTPRSSFALYKELVRHQSLPWRVAELHAAARFASTLQNQFHLEHLKAEEAQQRLLNEQLMKANKELANINWITSHDLKEPLRKILVFASKIMHEGEKELSENFLSSLTRIQQSAVRMQTLVNDILAYTVADDKTAAFVPTDLNTVMAELVAEYAEDLRDRNGEIRYDRLPVVSAIPQQMRQLFGNLVGNALKFSKTDTAPAISLRCQQGTNSHGAPVYRLSLTDNGIGFDPAYGDKLFDIFYRIHDQKSYAGTGIGLAICKRIVENHGGRIWAEGEPGVGTSFWIELPKEA